MQKVQIILTNTQANVFIFSRYTYVNVYENYKFWKSISHILIQVNRVEIV